MPVACRNRNQTATNPLHLCKTADKRKKREGIFIQFNGKYHSKVWEMESVTVRILVSVYWQTVPNYVNFLIKKFASILDQHQNGNCGSVNLNFTLLTTWLYPCCHLSWVGINFLWLCFLNIYTYSRKLEFSLREKNMPKCRHCQYETTNLTKSLFQEMPFTSVASAPIPKKENSKCLVSLITFCYQWEDW